MQLSNMQLTDTVCILYGHNGANFDDKFYVTLRTGTQYVQEMSACGITVHASNTRFK